MLSCLNKITTLAVDFLLGRWSDISTPQICVALTFCCSAWISLVCTILLWFHWLGGEKIVYKALLDRKIRHWWSKTLSYLLHSCNFVHCLNTSFLCDPQWCVCTYQGQEPACGMLQVCNMWNVSQECWLLQYKQQAVLWHPCQTGG